MMSFIKFACINLRKEIKQAKIYVYIIYMQHRLSLGKDIYGNK